jgi:hypothetical protein
MRAMRGGELLLPAEIRGKQRPKCNKPFVKRLAAQYWEGLDEDDEFGELAELIVHGWGADVPLSQREQTRARFFARYEPLVAEDYGPSPWWRCHMDVYPEAWFAFALFKWSKRKDVRSFYRTCLQGFIDRGQFTAVHPAQLAVLQTHSVT